MSKLPLFQTLKIVRPYTYNLCTVLLQNSMLVRGYRQDLAIIEVKDYPHCKKQVHLSIKNLFKNECKIAIVVSVVN